MARYTITAAYQSRAIRTSAAQTVLKLHLGVVGGKAGEATSAQLAPVQRKHTCTHRHTHAYTYTHSTATDSGHFNDVCPPELLFASLRRTDISRTRTRACSAKALAVQRIERTASTCHENKTQNAHCYTMYASGDLTHKRTVIAADFSSCLIEFSKLLNLVSISRTRARCQRPMKLNMVTKAYRQTDRQMTNQVRGTVFGCVLQTVLWCGRRRFNRPAK